MKKECATVPQAISETKTYGGDTCPCKRTKCPRHRDCDACLKHHHAPRKKLLAACERIEAKKERIKQQETEKQASSASCNE